MSLVDGVGGAWGRDWLRWVYWMDGTSSNNAYKMSVDRGQHQAFHSQQSSSVSSAGPSLYSHSFFFLRSCIFARTMHFAKVLVLLIELASGMALPKALRSESQLANLDLNTLQGLRAAEISSLLLGENIKGEVTGAAGQESEKAAGEGAAAEGAATGEAEGEGEGSMYTWKGITDDKELTYTR